LVGAASHTHFFEKKNQFQFPIQEAILSLKKRRTHLIIKPNQYRRYIRVYLSRFLHKYYKTRNVLLLQTIHKKKQMHTDLSNFQSKKKPNCHKKKELFIFRKVEKSPKRITIENPRFD